MYYTPYLVVHIEQAGQQAHCSSAHGCITVVQAVESCVCERLEQVCIHRRVCFLQAL
jgi:hypothetical protein